MEFIQLQPRECSICYENTTTILCPLCHEYMCKDCILEYNKVNLTEACKCPSCKSKFNKLISYMIFGGESKTFIDSQISKYRNIVMINSTCLEFYKAFTEISKTQLDKLMEIPNFQLLLSYYIEILRGEKQITTLDALKQFTHTLYTDITEYTSNRKNMKKWREIMSNANSISPNKIGKTWHRVDSHIMKGVDCYFILREPGVFVMNISEDKKQKIVEKVECLCPPRRQYIDDRFAKKVDVPFDNKKYGCCHCNTFYIDDDDMNSENSKFNIADLLRSDDFKSFEYESESQYSENDRYHGGFIVKRWIETWEYSVDEKHEHDMLIECFENKDYYRFHLYLASRIPQLYRSKSKAKKIFMMNTMETFKRFLNILLIGQTPEQKDLCNIIKNNIRKLITTNNFERRIVDGLLHKMFINSGDINDVEEMHNFIRHHIYGDMNVEDIKKLDNLLLTSTVGEFVGDTYINVFQDKNNVTYEDIFGKLGKKYIIGQHVDSMSFMRCHACDGYVVVENEVKKCLKCKAEYCNVCHEIKKEGHVCDEDTIKSLQTIEEDCHKCPCCGVMIYRTYGCNHMFCTNCHNGFDWESGEKLNVEDQTNPLYFEWIEGQRTKDVVDDLGNVNDQHTEYKVNPYRWCKEQFAINMNTYKNKLIEKQDEIAKNLVNFMEKNDIALRMMHDVNRYKCLMGFTKHCYDAFENKIKVLFESVNVENIESVKKEIAEISMNHFNCYQQQCEMFNTMFIIGISGEECIEISLQEYRNDYKKLYDMIRKAIEKIGNNENDDEENRKDDVEMEVRKDVNYHKIKNFEERFNKCYDVMISTMPDIMSFDDVIKKL